MVSFALIVGLITAAIAGGLVEYLLSRILPEKATRKHIFAIGVSIFVCAGISVCTSQVDILIELLELTIQPPLVNAPTSTTSSTAENAQTLVSTSEFAPRSFNFRRANTALEEISSYRAIITMSGSSSINGGESFSLEMEMLVTTNPPASSFNFSDFYATSLDEEGIKPEGFGEISVVQVDGKTYTNLPGLGCNVTEGMESSMTEGLITRPDEMFDDLNSENVTLMEEGIVINGVATNHYHFDETAIQDSDASISTLSGDVYVAREGEFIVRFVIDGQGNVKGFGQKSNTDLSTFHMEFNVFDVNSNITITGPSECSTEATNSDYPMLADAYEVTRFAGVVTYKTNMDIADATMFYRNELTSQGWIVSFDYSDDITALITLQKEGNTLTVTVTIDPDSGANLVSLIES